MNTTTVQRWFIITLSIWCVVLSSIPVAAALEDPWRPGQVGFGYPWSIGTTAFSIGAIMAKTARILAVGGSFCNFWYLGGAFITYVNASLLASNILIDLYRALPPEGDKELSNLLVRHNGSRGWSWLPNASFMP